MNSIARWIAGMVFLPIAGAAWAAPKTFLANDYGATGDGKTLNTSSLQKAIDAARANGKGALAYLPAGQYVVKNTLNLNGGGYYFGGAGIYATAIEWRGAKDDPTLRVKAP